MREGKEHVDDQEEGGVVGGGCGVERCPYCGAALEVVWVHGHGQCRQCGTNIDPCCGGVG